MSSNPRHLILNLLLSNGGEALTAREAVASCALFGVLQNNTRVALARLQAAGLIESAGRSCYRLGPGGGKFERGWSLRPNNLVGGVAAARERLVKLGLEVDAIVFVAKDFDSAREQ